MKIKQIHKNILTLLLVVGSLFFVTKTVAISNPYRAGETRDPSCAPGDLFCTVNFDKDLYKENSSGGVSNTVSGVDAIVVGKNSTASGTSSIAIGQGDGISTSGPTASGDYSLSFGTDATASATNSISFLGTASGNQSIAIGEGSNAKSYKEVALGSYPTIYTPTSASSWSATDRLLNIGNGTSAVSTSDAFTILKNGNIGINNSNPGFSFVINTTDAIRLPSGDDADDRPNPSTKGLLRFNTASNSLEFANGESWIDISGESSNNFELIEETAKNIVDFPEANADNSLALGLGVISDSFGETSTGLYPLLYTPESTEAWKAGDGLFTIGRGYSTEGRKNAFIINKNGTVGIGNVTIADLTTASGANIFLTTETGAFLTVDGTWTDASDESLKSNIEDLRYGLDEVNDIRPRSFEFKKSGQASVGFVAQELEDVIPELVSNSGMGTKGVSYGQMTAVLVKAVQELSDKVDRLEGKTVTKNQPETDTRDEEEEEIEEEPEEEIVEQEEENPLTPEEDQGAMLINTSDNINLTNIMLMLIAGLLLINIIMVAQRVNRK